MARINRPDFADALTAALFPSGELVNPKTISDDVVFTYPFLSAQQHLITKLKGESVLGAAAATSVVSSTVPANSYRWVLAASVKNTSGADTFTNLNVRANIGGVAFEASLLDALSTQGTRGILRPILVPPGGLMVGVVAVAGAGSSVKIDLVYLELLLGEPPPWV